MPLGRARCEEGHAQRRGGDELGDAGARVEVRRKVEEGRVLEVEVRVGKEDIDWLEWRCIADQDCNAEESGEWVSLTKTPSMSEIACRHSSDMSTSAPVIPMHLIKPSSFISSSVLNASNTF